MDRANPWTPNVNGGQHGRRRRLAVSVSDNVSAQFRLSHFLRDGEWEATSNGAERMGRAFRHRQAPHFSLRTKQTIEDALVLDAFERKEQALAPTPERLHRCQRGRHRRAPAPTVLQFEERMMEHTWQTRVAA